MKLKKKIKFCFVSRGPGETGQARALAKFLEKKGGKIIFCLHQEKNLFFLEKDKNFKIYLTPRPDNLKKVILKEKPHFLLLFNSKMWGGDFLKEPPFKRPPFVFCFDSNWLFNSKKYPLYDFIKWADKYFILFPEKIFKLGLKENGGNFEIEKNVKEKIEPLGFIPSYEPIGKKLKEKIREKLKIKRNEKFIFSYFSGWGAGHRIWALKNFEKAVDILVKEGKKIKAMYVGPVQDLSLKETKRDWLLIKEKLSAKDFFSILASSDLIFMHQGMVTLAQAICCQIPVVCNVSILKKEMARLHFWEVLPFKKAGVCEMLSKSTKVEKIKKVIFDLLYNEKRKKEMQKRQKEIFEGGERNFFEKLKKFL